MSDKVREAYSQAREAGILDSPSSYGLDPAVWDNGFAAGWAAAVEACEDYLGRAARHLSSLDDNEKYGEACCRLYEARRNIRALAPEKPEVKP